MDVLIKQKEVEKGGDDTQGTSSLGMVVHALLVAEVRSESSGEERAARVGRGRKRIVWEARQWMVREAFSCCVL